MLFPLCLTLLLGEGCTPHQKTVTYPHHVPVKKQDRSRASNRLLKDAEQTMAAGQYSQAEILLERALRIDSNNEELWHAMAQLKLAINQPSQTVQFCLKSNSLAGNNTRITRSNWILMEKAYLRMGERKLAAQAQQQYMAIH